MKCCSKPVVIFDLWNTLVSGLSEDPVLSLQRQFRHKLAPEGEAATTLDPDFLTLCLTTDVSRPGRFVERVGSRIGVVADASLKAAFRELTRRERQSVRLFPETEEALSRLKKAGWRLGLLSNLWPFPVNHIMVTMGLGRYFDEAIYSFAEGYRKPHRRIFEIAARRLGAPPGHCLMVGDSLASDVQGAVDAGMSAALVWRNHAPPPPLPDEAVSVSSLLQIAA